MVKPFISYSIERYAGVALVTVARITDDGGKFHREVLSQYETLGHGAAASAKREVRKFERELTESLIADSPLVERG